VLLLVVFSLCMYVVQYLQLIASFVVIAFQEDATPVKQD